MDSGFGRHEIHEYHSIPVPAGADSLSIAGDFLARLPRQPERLVMSIPTQQSTLRNFEFPTKDRKAIASSVLFELEDELPFPIDETTHAYQSYPHPGGTASHVHVYATLKRNLRERIAKWDALGIKPDVVTTEAWAFRCLLQRVAVSPQDQNPRMIIHLGHTRSLIFVFHGGLPIIAREIPWGTSHLSVVLAQNLGVSLQETDALLVDHGLVAQGHSDDPTSPAHKVASALLPELERLILAVKQAEFSTKAMTKFGNSQIFTSGQSSLIPGLSDYISQELHIPIEPLSAMKLGTFSAATYAPQTEAEFALAMALALTQVGTEAKQGINLRKGEFAKAGAGKELDWSMVKGPLLGFSLVSLSLVSSLIFENIHLQKELSAADTKLEKALKNFFGPELGKGTIKNYTSNLSSLKKAIRNQVDQEKTLAEIGAPQPHFPLDFVKNLSAQVSRDVVVDLIQLQVGAKPEGAFDPSAPTQATLTFVVAQPQMAEKIANLMESRLTSMTRSKTEEFKTPSGEKKYKITLSGTPGENMYGTR
jgi:type IV pilus assembly protein PilM